MYYSADKTDDYNISLIWVWVGGVIANDVGCESGDLGLNRISADVDLRQVKSSQ